MSTTPEARPTRRAFVGLLGASVGALALVTSLPAPAALAGQPPLQIWFIRHGESELNVPGTPRTVPDGGVSYPLTRRGVEQARALAESLSDAPIAKIYTSTHLRAIQTADALALEHLLPLALAPEAVEIDFGVGVNSGQDVRAVYSELSRKWLIEKDLDARHGDGESFADVQRRFLPFVREVMNRHALDSGIVVIVAHSATLGFLVPVLANNVPADFALRHPLPNTGIIKTELRDSRLFCTEWAGLTTFGE
ncbi:histidine phosphatase family protein [Steroidobacter sp. S1-65]|uniref:Histidine phosphatase family protein n=1 Tax=Steroidobacter gossypii TaxID=2805490 RepID=A0ABS1WRS7_9GAMM|nr:histidine phosphatase family protein [Steroidobacter gossypii]MBM0103681.1 histidine phosphatase family protein [Steroidobacter gossypii]